MGFARRLPNFHVGYKEANVSMTFDSHAAYAARRISSKLNGGTKQFGWLQAPATKNSFFFLALRTLLFEDCDVLSFLLESIGGLESTAA